LESGHPLLAQAALDAVRQWKYAKPAVAPMHFEVTVRFELPRKTESTSAGTEAGKAYEQAAVVKPDATAEEYLNKALAASERRQAAALKPVRTVDPVYPPEAKAMRIQGNVVLSVTVDKSGKVSNLEVLSGPEQLVKAALDAVKQWEYEPPAIAPAVTTVTVNFTLSDSEAQAQAIYRVGGDVRAPKPTFKPDPPYTKEARKDKIQGKVDLSLVVDAEGNVAEARVVKALDPGLDQNALRTIRTWKFEPATRNGKPVPVRVTVEVEFKLF
jgi:TonB family protein